MRGTERDRKRNFSKKVSEGGKIPIEYLEAVVDFMWGAFTRGLEEHSAACPLCGSSHDIEIICHHCGYGEEKYG